MRRNIKRSAVVGGTIAAVFGVGIGFAAWTNYGEGSGAVTAGNPVALTVQVSGVGGLVPNGSVDVPFTVENLNPYKVELTKAELVSVTTTKAGCDAAVVTGVDVPLSEVVAAGATGTSHDFPVDMSNDAVDACQGAVFTVKLGVTGLSTN
jgi:hypothetical protein